MEKKWQVFGLVAVSIFMSTLDSSIVNVALPYMMQDLSETMGTIQWVVTVYLLTVSSFLLTFGRLSDIKGRPVVYRMGFGFFTLGSFLCGVSGTVFWLILARAVQGLGASMLMACSPALIVDVFEPEHRGRALGLVGACVAAGLTTGPLAGGLLLEYFSWRSIFFINIPVGIWALMATGGIFEGNTRKTEESLDLTGCVSLAFLVCCLIISLVHAGDWGLLSLKGLFFLGAGVISGLIFVRNARRNTSPLFDLKLLGIRLFVMPLAASLVLFMALFTLIFMMPFYLSLACSFSPAQTGMTMIVPFFFLLVVSPVSGGLADRLGSRGLCGAGMGCLAFALFLLGGLTPEHGHWSVLWRLGLAGFGTAMFISPNAAVIMGAVPADRRGIASGAVATARNLGMVIGVAVSSAVFTYTYTRLVPGGGLDHYKPEMAPYFMAGFRHVMWTGAIVAGIGVLVTLARGRDTVSQQGL
ncbi:MAG: MFS transporter [Desulfobacterales bacterium]|nr:MFS transporter [Desulfobacterales bacterium]